MSERLAAQAPRTTTLDFATGSEFEDYLRVLQVAGLQELRPWSIRRVFSRRDHPDGNRRFGRTVGAAQEFPNRQADRRISGSAVRL